ncbi:MAG: magnesium chelatase ATPase subunit I [Acidobacteria bacterium]|nr:magnesium chelatase ATPase subunit I [Acidobacteriota bacterium]
MTRRTNTPKKQSAQLLPGRRVYPFAAIVGQAELKLGLLLNVIAPSIGGVLVMGHRGTGKSTAVRALAELLPPLTKVRGCLYGCDPAAEANFCADCRTRRASQGALPTERAPVPVVDLPLNATEDRVAGAINLERAIKEGVRTFEPGLLARAHRGFLYIDEVNLLEDHLVDLLLDVAASGRNRVEREGVSIEHPSEFVLAGSGNPEEGELRPQLVDRFGLYTEIRTAADVEERVAIITRREAFDRDPATFCAAWETEQARLRRRLVRARAASQSVRLATELVHGIAELCGRLGVDGHRGELTIARAARALAAFENRKEVAPQDVRRVASMALRHRLRRDPLEQTDDGSRIEQAAHELFGAGDAAEPTTDAAEPGATNASKRQSKKTPPSHPDETGGSDHGGGGGGERRDTRGADDGRAPQTQNEERPAPTLDAKLPESFGEKFVAKKSPANSAASARRQINSRATSSHTRGRYSRAVARRTTGETGDLKIALDATLRVAAASQMARRRSGRSARAFEVETSDLRYKHFSRRTGTLFIFAVDTSGSMAHNRISQAKGALARLLRESYVNRDRVALITFRERAASVLLQPSQSSARACRLLDALPVGGATPLTSALLRALEMSERAARSGTARICLLVFTDGRANVPCDGRVDRDRAGVRRQIKSEVEKIGVALQRTGVASVVVDTQNRFTRGGEGQTLAQALGGRYVHLPALQPASQPVLQPVLK